MKFEILPFLFTAVLASPTQLLQYQQALQPLTDLLNTKIGAFEGPEKPAVCWKKIFKNDATAASVAFGNAQTDVKCDGKGENVIQGVCYGPCPESYVPIDEATSVLCFSASAKYPFTFRPIVKDVSKTASAEVLSSETCPAGHSLMHKSFCAQDGCPAVLPTQCGVFCTKNGFQCTQTVAHVGLAIFKILQAGTTGDWVTAATTIKDLVLILKAYPQCDSLQADFQQKDLQMLMQLLTVMAPTAAPQLVVQ